MQNSASIAQKGTAGKAPEKTEKAAAEEPSRLFQEKGKRRYWHCKSPHGRGGGDNSGRRSAKKGNKKRQNAKPQKKMGLPLSMNLKDSLCTAIAVKSCLVGAAVELLFRVSSKHGPFA